MPFRYASQTSRKVGKTTQANRSGFLSYPIQKPSSPVIRPRDCGGCVKDAIQDLLHSVSDVQKHGNKHKHLNSLRQQDQYRLEGAGKGGGPKT
jgi:hypothetical protein